MTVMHLPHGDVELPAFFPDGTRGVVRCVDSQDLENSGVAGIVMNTYHLMSKPGHTTIKAMGGLNEFISWKRPILTDSGGFQVFSMMRENSKFGEIRPDAIVFTAVEGGKRIKLSPEKCIQYQFSYGSDIMMCLDYCTHPNDPYEINRLAVDTTIRWAKQCKREYLRLCEGSKKKRDIMPRLFGIVQGGEDRILRRECAQALIEVGFDGFGFGGWPLDTRGNLMEEMLSYTAALMPDDTPKYAMGLGTPQGIVACHKMGFNLFDCVIPTREARHNRLYIWNEEYSALEDIDLNDDRFCGHYYIKDDKYWRDSRPISPLCDCYCCQNYSRAYLRHLYMIGDAVAYRLATMHNLRFYTQLMDLLRK